MTFFFAARRATPVAPTPVRTAAALPAGVQTLKAEDLRHVAGGTNQGGPVHGCPAGYPSV